jgi:hypothetical protein
MEEELQITNERIDDFVVLLTLMQQMDLPGILDRHLPRHWLQQGLSWGWTASIWLAHIVSQGDHRKLTVRDWVRQAHRTLEQVTGLDIRETDFTDDRLTIVLRHLSDAARWQAIEQDLGEHLMRVYDLEEQPIRVDATTVSGYRNGGEDSLWQFGYSKDDPTLRQIKAMMATLDPLGLPLTLEVVSGEQADDRLYIPTIDRVLAYLGRTGLLFVGDCKMSALATRAHLVAQQQYYLTPLALLGETAQQMPDWIQAGVAQGEQLTEVLADDEKQVLAQGYAREPDLCLGRTHLARTRAGGAFPHLCRDAASSPARPPGESPGGSVGTDPAGGTWQTPDQRGGRAPECRRGRAGQASCRGSAHLHLCTREHASRQVCRARTGWGQPETSGERAGALPDHRSDAQ